MRFLLLLLELSILADISLLTQVSILRQRPATGSSLPRANFEMLFGVKTGKIWALQRRWSIRSGHQSVGEYQTYFGVENILFQGYGFVVREK